MSLKNNSNLLISDKQIEKLDLPVFIKNVNGLYIYCNQAFADFLGVPKNTILGHTAYDIAPKKLADLYVEADKELLEDANAQCYKSLVQTSEAQAKVTFRKSIIYTPEHEIAGFIGTVDVHARIKKDLPADFKNLTPREIDVLNLLVKGNSVKAIAILLGISNHTVTDYLKNIYRKLDVHSKNEALFRVLTLLTISPNSP